MPKRKANWWPASILSDPDVLSMDDEGRFVLCKICHVHYAVHGGKKPKPVIMNSNFRTRAWDVHKERTNSHRMQKQQERLQQQQQQQKQQQQQAAQAPAPAPRRQHEPDEETKDSDVHAQATAPSHAQPPPVPAPHAGHSGHDQPATTTAATATPSSQLGKRAATASAGGAPSPRRQVFRAGSPGSSRLLVAESEAMRRQQAHERASFASTAGLHPRRSDARAGGAHTEQQREGGARWRHMHHDVGRAGSQQAALKRRQAASGAGGYTSGELRAANVLAESTGGGFGGNNSEKVAKKLRSLNREYDAKALRHTELLYDRRSASYKQYWGTLRDVYTSTVDTHAGQGQGAPPTRKKSGGTHRGGALSKQPSKESMTEADSTTPDDSGGSSEDAFKPTVVVHDESLVHAIDRLTEATATYMSELSTQETTSTREALEGLTAVMTDLRVQQGNAFGRIIELQEKHLKVMEGILQHKLRKEQHRDGARNASGSNNNSSSATAGSASGAS